jgi:hypothetical protein
MVAFEPRDAQGRLVKGPGAVSVVVLDPALEGESGRVARWDFEPDEVPSHFRNTPFGRGLQFELPWPSEPPKNRDLRLYVRFTTPTGQKITTESPLVVRTAEDLPTIDRKTKDATAQDTGRSKRKSTPTSRLKSPRVALSEPREIQPADQAEELAEADSREPEDAPAFDGQPRDEADQPEPRAERSESEEPEPRQQPERRSRPPRAARVDRPEWKPYR